LEEKILVGEWLVFWCIIARLCFLLFGYIKHELKNIVYKKSVARLKGA